MEERIKQLEKKVAQLEKPIMLNDNLKQLLIRNGFLIVDKVLNFESMAGVTFLSLISRTGNDKVVLTASPDAYYKEFTVDITNDLILSKAHGLSDDKQVIFLTTGDLPGGIDVSSSYWVVNSSTDDFQISLTSGGTPIDITSGGTGIHYWQFLT